MSIKIVGVVGAGTMGSGIAQTFAQAGLDVRLVDVAQPLLDRARRSVESSLAKFVEKGRLSRRRSRRGAWPSLGGNDARCARGG